MLDADFTTKVTNITATRTVKIKVSGEDAGKLDKKVSVWITSLRLSRRKWALRTDWT